MATSELDHSAGGTPVEVRPVGEDERGLVTALWLERWATSRVVSRGRVHEPMAYPMLVALHDERIVGALSYEIRRAQAAGSAGGARPRYGEMEAVTIDAFQSGLGAGTALIEAAAEEARRRNCRRLWLITTNDNTPALRFYQRRGMRLVAVHRGAVDAARALKPEIPPTGIDGIPIRDELELELRFE